MKKLALAAALVFGAAGAVTSAQAMPVLQAPGIDGGIVPGIVPGIVNVAQGCGPGGHRDYYGRCVPNFVRRPFYRACPPGFHLNPYGHCRPNF